MAEELRRVKKELGLKCCPYCGAKMNVSCDVRSDRFINGEFSPGCFVYNIGCLTPGCLHSFDSCDEFYITEHDLEDFINRFNHRVSDSEIYSISVDTSILQPSD